MAPQTNPSPQIPTHAPHDQPVRPDTKPCENRTMAQRVLVHISRSEQRVIDPDDIYCIVASGGATEIRLRTETPLVDIRQLGEVAPPLEPHGLVRIHHQHAVNL
jgi:DNA-binding LytR/AlgR family response regulator